MLITRHISNKIVELHALRWSTTRRRVIIKPCSFSRVHIFRRQLLYLLMSSMILLPPLVHFCYNRWHCWRYDAAWQMSALHSWEKEIGRYTDAHTDLSSGILNCQRSYRSTIVRWYQLWIKIWIRMVILEV